MGHIGSGDGIIYYQLELVCEQCHGQRLIRSDDTPTEVCDWCDGSGVDPFAACEPMANRIDKLARMVATTVTEWRAKEAGAN